MNKTLASKKQAWLYAIRLRTLPLALSSIFMGSFLAAYDNAFRWQVFVLAAFTTIFLQILSNLANDYGDSIHGADSLERQGPIRAVQSGVISLGEMKRAMIIFVILSLLSGVLLIFVALNDWKLFLIFLGIGLAAIVAAITYTSGKNPYGYAGLGDLSVFLFFGLIGVLGTFYLHTMGISLPIILPAISLGLFSTAVLNINNVRDIASDTLAGKKSIPVRVGRRNAVIYNWILLVSGNAMLVVFAFLTGNWGVLLAFFTVPLMLAIGYGVQHKQQAAELDPYLKKMALSTLIWVILFGIGLLLF